MLLIFFMPNMHALVTELSLLVNEHLIISHNNKPVNKGTSAMSESKQVRLWINVVRQITNIYYFLLELKSSLRTLTCNCILQLLRWVKGIICLWYCNLFIFESALPWLIFRLQYCPFFRGCLEVRNYFVKFLFLSEKLL